MGRLFCNACRLSLQQLNTVRKRPRYEIERLYHCSWPACNRAYETLNHLNAHIQMQKHGAKRSPKEFTELRRQWRKAKKDLETPLGLSAPSSPC
ncbi:hypothetical protein C8F01DRAFT_994601 [Mycena amicta]|nr:hypothetical protein C8F01DRAFT_994601 [Mycena amicta]